MEKQEVIFRLKWYLIVANYFLPAPMKKTVSLFHFQVFAVNHFVSFHIINQEAFVQ